MTWAPEGWGSTTSNDRFWIWAPTRLGVCNPGVYRLRIYSLGVCSLSDRSWIWGPTHLRVYRGIYSFGVCNLGVYMLERPILDLATHSLIGRLQCGSLQSGATNFGSRNPFIGPEIYNLKIYNLGVYMLERPILDFAAHSLDWEPHRL